MDADIIIIGGGASGYAAAITAMETCPAAKVIIAEKLSRTGKKILATGNGKCNLSNSSISEKNYHGSFNAMEFIGNSPDWYSFFTEKLGVLCVTGSEGREGGIYPRSNSAATILSALRLRTAELGVTEMCDTDITAISPLKNSFSLTTKSGTVLTCKRIIIAAGGYAGPSFGTDGAMMRVLKDMGYKSAKICPAVAPLKVPQEELKGLKGVRVRGRVSAMAGGKVLRSESGEIQFNENTISGICVFNQAYLFAAHEGELSLRLDLAPDMDERTLTDYLFKIRKRRGNCSAEELLTGMFLKNLAIYLVKRLTDVPLSAQVKSIPDNQIRQIASAIKALDFHVSGCASWQNSQVTMGGIHRKCVDERLCSVLHKGMYLFGEILDVAGDCGGFNLQWAWSSGYIAGKNCALSLSGDRYDKSFKH